jgi:uncharacterized protein (UPF0276 family)
MSVKQNFQERANAVPRLGLGLSVDVYSPDLWDLMGRFDVLGFQPAYLEIFRAASTALQAVRRELPDLALAYHGEGLWITQPDFNAAPFVKTEIDVTASHLDILRSPWLNHECATKQMGGYAFGTYLPPLYTGESAKLVSDNIALVQERLDTSRRPDSAFGPLFLLEMPPLTYFMAGTVSVPEYFRLVTEHTPCGLVLDIGHLWTVYRYSAAHHQSSLERFVQQFLDEFPMDRVIEIHIAGLARHESEGPSAMEIYPEWIDAHAAPIPPVSWALLEQVLGHSRLRNLRGVALEVDTKPVERIVEEFGKALARVGAMVEHVLNKESVDDCFPKQPESGCRSDMSVVDRRRLEADYVEYAQIACGQRPPAGSAWKAVVEDRSGLERYIHAYLPHEILHWGGDIHDMFPETCRGLSEQGLSLDEFVPWWFHKSRPADQPYDFFLLKIDRVVEYVAERAPSLMGLARAEAGVLRSAYDEANVGGRPHMESYR